MKEIKFRAWDGERLRKVNTIGWVDESVDFVTTPRYSGPAEDFRLMQYTGLKDKNGVEIYEGDIVRCFRDGPSEVVFKKGCFGLETYIAIGNYYSTFDEVYGYCEIIGNIYENPELLEREGK